MGGRTHGYEQQRALITVPHRPIADEAQRGSAGSMLLLAWLGTAAGCACTGVGIGADAAARGASAAPPPC